MKVVHAIKSEDITLIDMLEVLHKFMEEKAKEVGRTVIFPEDFADMVSIINNRIFSHEKHLIEL